MTRLYRRVLAIGLALLALTGLFVVALLGRSSGAPPAASQQLEAAAERRTANSTDQIIWEYQDRIHQNADDVAAYSTLGAAYLQRSRETGDPSYYGKAEAVFAEAIKRDPQNVDALVGQGALANARHQFHDALALGEQARAINPTIARTYGVI
ncbi:MAG TPA: hypothetical protein VFX76_13470, partial [Roseiflexaceae bacterium]|nr:hypothetical protein [Roseiflexaceae bacterium]